MDILGTQSDRFKLINSNGKIQNGSYWYAKEIEENILPEIDAEVQIVTCAATAYVPSDIMDGGIIVCHDNRNTLHVYKNLLGKELLWITSKKSTRQNLLEAGEDAIYIPLSIDTEYVKHFKQEKRHKDTAFVGNRWHFKLDYLKKLPKDIDQLSGLPRDELLEAMADYKRIIAEGRCLMEAQILGAKCEVPQYPGGIEAEFVKPLDNRDIIDDWSRAILDHSSKCCTMITMRDFNDLRFGKLRHIGQTFSVSLDRAKELLNNENNIVRKV